MKMASIVSLFIALAISSTSWANQADTLFQHAIAAEQAGRIADRDRLLTDVLSADPDHRLARWHSGQVLHNGKWQTLEKVERLVSSDPRWREYNDRVAEGEDTLLSHAKMARWCRGEGLQLEEQWHWHNVLRHDPANREALGALKLRPYRGAYLTKEQIDEYEAVAKQAKADFNRYSKELKAAMREVEQASDVERTAALKKISLVNDPAAIPAIVEVVLADAKSEKRIISKFGNEKGESLLRQMQRAAIGALAEMPDHEATLTLMDVAIYASDTDIRRDAAESLKYRELTAFVPLLMAQLSAPIEVDRKINTLPNGEISVFEDFYEAEPLSVHKHSRSSTYLTQFIRRASTDIPGIPRPGFGQRRLRATQITGVWSDRARDYANATANIVRTDEFIDAENAARETKNLRVQEVLKVVIGEDHGTDAAAWWKSWNYFNELNTPEDLPTYETSERLDYTVQQVSEFQLGGETYSCFVAGTLVWTQAGPVAIEKIKVGELVLSQNPHSGELDYRPVLRTSVGPPSSTVKLALNDDVIIATLGHRFWNTGRGWQMAKFLKTGDAIYRLGGTTDIQAVTKDTDAEAFNLEVGEFHTFFVGKSRVLVHDITCPQPTTSWLPGAPSRSGNVPQLATQN
jgi:hypothetical protein